MGTGTRDDAGVYRLGAGSAGLALVQTVDFFTPVVDDPYDWGRIAAANALSDIYAMGGAPLTALQLVGWPRGVLDLDLAGEVVRGGLDVMADAGCTVVGGHSIDDAEPTYGFAVTGTVDPSRIVTNAAGRAGDVLVLTKPLGTGIITTALKAGACPPDILAGAVDAMTLLNGPASAVMVRHDVLAATDVTGFGLLGHLSEMLAGAGLAAAVDVGAVPLLPGAAELLDLGHYPGGSGRNLDAVSGVLDGGDVRTRRLLADAQTSGGLLVAVAPERADDLVAEMRSGAAPEAAVIGRLTAGEPGRIILR